MSKLRILIADDHALVRMGISALLTAQRDMTVVGQAEDGEEAVRVVAESKPDLVLMDLVMPRLDGAEAARRIRAVSPATDVIILTSYATAPELAVAVANGVRGAQFKGSPTDSLLAAIRAVAAGGTAFAPEIRPLLDAASAVPALSPRQREVLDALARGLTNDDIATLLGISTPRVKQLTKALYDKLGAANRAEAVARAMQHRLLTD